MEDENIKTAEELDIESTVAQDKAIVQALIDAEDGPCKNASAAGSKMIRRRIRENGFSRKIIPPSKITDADLNRLLETEKPAIIEDMEPDQPPAKSISFNDTPDTEPYRGDRFLIIFNKITSKEFTKNTDELRTQKFDLRQVVQDNSLKDIQTEEDRTFINTVDEIVGSPSGVGASGLKQSYVSATDLTRDSYVPTINYLQDRYLNNGVFLLNRHTASRILAWQHDQIGGTKSQDNLYKGLEALSEGVFLGIRHLFTIKNEIVPIGYVYQFAEPQYLGRFYILEDVTMFVEKKKDILRFSAHEKIGVTIANVAAVGLVNFTNVP
jgi:hypothetical protein